jgi:subtilase family serine protease
MSRLAGPSISNNKSSGETEMRPRILLAFLSISALLLTSAAQTAHIQPRITQAVDDNNLIPLTGNVHPLARAEFDRGAAPASLPMNRMLLVLQHSPEQEAAVNKLLDGQQDKSSPNYHHWLTPQQFGEQYEPAAEDIQTVTTWLQGHGFTVARLSNGQHVIEFSGTAGQVQEAFHTAIHKYAVNGEEHWANASDPMLPAALAPVVAGLVSLHNFPSHPMSHVAGTFRRIKGHSELKALQALFTFPSNSPFAGFFGLGPADFATIYNVQPLWKAGIDGTGQSIAIVQESNINIQDVRNFRNLFGLPANDPQIILDGPDPGIVPGVETEALLDTEWSGGVAKGATIKVVVASTTNTTAGIDLAALRIVDDVIAPVASESFGRCELFEGTTRNQFFRTTWQQAAAEGISVFVSAGDAGATGCENFNLPAENLATLGLEISGSASTPYDIAVGGTASTILLTHRSSGVRPTIQ